MKKFFTAVWCAVLLAACGGGGSDSGPPRVIDPPGVTLPPINSGVEDGVYTGEFLINRGGNSSNLDIRVRAEVRGNVAQVTHSAYLPGSNDLCKQRTGRLTIGGRAGDMFRNDAGARSCTQAGDRQAVPATLTSNGVGLRYTLMRPNPRSGNLVVELTR